MKAGPFNHFRLILFWLLAIAIPVLVQVLLVDLLPDNGEQRAITVFVVTVSAAVLHLLAGLLVWARARRLEQPELGYLSAFFLTLLVILLAHGLLTPGVIFGPNEAFHASLFWSIPAVLIAGSPGAIRTDELHRKLDPAWQRWVSWWVAGSLAAALLLFVCLLYTSPSPRDRG